jgi:hypothetical protein
LHTVLADFSMISFIFVILPVLISSVIRGEFSITSNAAHRLPSTGFSSAHPGTGINPERSAPCHRVRHEVRIKGTGLTFDIIEAVT